MWYVASTLADTLYRDIPLPPVLYDVAFHLVPAVVLTIDSLLLSPPWPTTPMNESAPMLTLAISTMTAFSYWTWIVSLDLPETRPIPIDRLSNDRSGSLLLPKRLLSLPHLRSSYHQPAHWLVRGERSHHVGCWRGPKDCVC